MSDFKINPPGQPPQPQGVERAQRGAKSGRPQELTSEAASETEATTTPTAVTPTDIVQRLRTGELDLDGAVNALIEQALATGPVAAAPEAVRQRVRSALIELVRDDPTLTALASAMKR